MVSDKAAELKRGLLVEDELLRLPTRAESGQEERPRKSGEPRFLLLQESSPDLSGDTQVDIYEQMKWQIQSVARDPPRLLVEDKRGGSRETEHESRFIGTGEALSSPIYRERRAKRDVDTHASDRRDEVPIYRDWVTEAQREARDSSAEEKSPDLSGLEEFRKSVPIYRDKGKWLDSETASGSRRAGTTPQVSRLKDDVSAKAREILGEHKTFASFAEDKFNRHMRAAEEYLKRGRYYRAADAYTLAAIYKTDDPLAYAGKSHALFAAGEYMSSALFLSRALEIFPEYAQFKIDLVAMVGDKDKLESRLANVEEWLDESDAAELQFLLGYVYYQMGRQEEAEEMIYAAFKRMPESPAVVALKKAITGAAE
jgi:tetratricopeptide (TPR) repeat protein